MPRLRTGATITTLTTVLTLLSGALLDLSAPLPAQAAAPTLTVTRIVGGLKIPWDVTWVANVMLFDQRAGGVWSKQGSATPTRVAMALPPVFHLSEAGMLGMVADPRAATNKNFYTCIAVATPSGKARDVEVWKWRLTTNTNATLVNKLITGIPLISGRHSGCRLRFRSAEMLYVGTGDAAKGTNPQNLKSLGGKILRVRSDGSIPTTNPFYKRGGNARYVWNYGHRNVQGLVERPGTTELWSVEQGTNRDDEINRVYRGHNYGWDPTPGYDESRPMTDKRRFPHANGAKWRSGYPTVATCGATFITGSQWGPWNGMLAVAMLKGQGVKLFTIQANKITKSQAVLRGYGRIRTVQQGPGGAVYFTTANGSNDGIYQITAR
jgi:glucose/arabinose dehydrogenase